MNSLIPPEVPTISLIMGELSLLPPNTPIKVGDSSMIELCYSDGILTFQPFGTALLKHSIKIEEQLEEGEIDENGDENYQDGDDYEE